MFRSKITKRLALLVMAIVLIWLGFLVITRPRIERPSRTASSEPAKQTQSQVVGGRTNEVLHNSITPLNSESPPIIAEATGVIEGRLGRVPLDLAEEAQAEAPVPPALSPPIPAYPLPPGARVVRTEIPLVPSTPSGESERPQK